MINKHLTRRNFLKTAGMGSLVLATSPLSLIPEPSSPLEFLDVFPMYPDEESFNATHKCISVRDTFRFIPKLCLDIFYGIDAQSDIFNHIILNVYEFTFRPLLKHSEPCNMILGPLVPGGTERKAEAYETYLIKIASKLIAGYDRIKIIGEENLQVDQLYRGYGKFGNTDWSPSGSNGPAFSSRIETLNLNVRVEEILEHGVIKTRRNEQIKTYHEYGISDASIHHGNYLYDLYYYHDFEQFKKTSVFHRYRFKKMQTNEGCAFPIYRLRIL